MENKIELKFVDNSLQARIQRDCYRLLISGKPTYGQSIKLECTRFEFINEFLPGVYVEMDILDPYTGKKYRRIVPKRLERELAGLPPKPERELTKMERAKCNAILERVEASLQQQAQAHANQLQEIENKEIELQLFPEKCMWRKEMTEEERFDNWLHKRTLHL